VDSGSGPPHLRPDWAVRRVRMDPGRQSALQQLDEWKRRSGNEGQALE
jgi:hypothetical protein